MHRQLRMTAYLLLALGSLLGAVFLLSGFVSQLPADPTGSMIDALVASLLGNSLTRLILMDVGLAGLAFLIWLVHEANSLSMRRPWIYVALLLATPLAFVVPLFLFMREWKLKKLGWD